MGTKSKVSQVQQITQRRKEKNLSNLTSNKKYKIISSLPEIRSSEACKCQQISRIMISIIVRIHVPPMQCKKYYIFNVHQCQVIS